jgi:hypothetical protein
MSALLRAELLKLRTTRTFVAMAAATLATSLLLVGLVCLLTEPTEGSVLTDVYTTDTSVLFILMLAIVGITGEWRHRTIAGSLLVSPDRVRFLAAKTVAFAAAGLVLSLVVSAAVALVGTAILVGRDLPVPGFGEVLGQMLHNAIPAALLGAFGVGIGALVRNQVVAIVGALVLLFVVEPTLTALVPNVGRFGPFNALPSAAQDVPAEVAGFEEGVLIAPGLAVMAMLVWIGAAAAAGAVLLRRRDVG